MLKCGYLHRAPVAQAILELVSTLRRADIRGVGSDHTQSESLLDPSVPSLTHM